MQILALCLSPFILTVNRVKLSEKGRKEISDRVIAACKKLGKLPRPVRIRQNGKLLFLRKILPGAADESYGIEVAKLVGSVRCV